MNRGDLKDSSQLSLELSNAQGAQLISHYNDFNKRYKLRLENIQQLKSLVTTLQTVKVVLNKFF